MLQFKADSIEWAPINSEVETSIYGIVEYLQLNDRQRSQTELPFIRSVRDETYLGRMKSDEEAKGRNSTSSRCAYCEGNRDTRWYRHQPTGRAMPETKGEFSKDFYAWFAWDPSNLLPICSDCLPKDNGFYPVRRKRARPSRQMLTIWTRSLQRLQGTQRGDLTITNFALPDNYRIELEKAEQPILHRPGNIKSYGGEYSFDLRTFELFSKSSRAKLTIDHFNLNAPNTVELRRKVILERLGKLSELGPEAEFDFRNVEYGGAWYLAMKTVITRMLRDSDVQGDAYPNLIRSAVKKLYNDPVWRSFEEYVANLSSDERIDAPRKAPTKSTRYFDKAIRDREKLRRTARYTQSQPRLTSVSVKNYKSLEAISLKIGHDTPLEDPNISESSSKDDTPVPALLLLGENATGKSSMLEAISLAALPDDHFEELREATEGDLEPGRLILDPEFLGSPNLKKRSEAEIVLTFKTDAGDSYVDSLTVGANGFSRPRKTKAGRPEHDIMIFAYGAHRLFGRRRSDRFGHSAKITPDDPLPVITLFRNDVLLPNPEDWLTDLSKKDLNEVFMALREVIQVDGRFRDIEVVKDRKGRKYCRINIQRVFEEVVDPLEAEIFSTPFTHVSSGYRVVIALICDVLKGVMDQLGELSENEVGSIIPSVQLARKLPVLVLIDEVEAHLHPRWKLEVISGLRRALPKATFVMSSHDPLCVRGMENDEVVVFNRIFDAKASGTTTKESVEVISEFPDFKKMTVEQLLTSNLFQLYSADDRRLEREFARVVDGLSKGKKPSELGLSRNDQDALDKFKTSINAALPIGMSEAEQVVHQAVAQYLSLRRASSKEKSNAARQRAIEKIVEALEIVGGEVDRNIGGQSDAQG